MTFIPCTFLSCMLICCMLTETSALTLRLPRSCAEVKCANSSATDGEYWLEVTQDTGSGNVEHVTGRIYCNQMTSSEPEEFMTLTGDNHAFRDPYTATPGSYLDSTGHTTYSKVGILFPVCINVSGSDEFSVTSGNSRVEYGEAQDCITPHGDGGVVGYDTRGTFNIDLRGTGFKVRDDIQWKRIGWIPGMDVSKQYNGQVVTGLCGGYCGGCKPDTTDGHIPLNIIPSDVPAASSATAVYLVPEPVWIITDDVYTWKPCIPGDVYTRSVQNVTMVTDTKSLCLLWCQTMHGYPTNQCEFFIYEVGTGFCSF